MEETVGKFMKQFSKSKEKLKFTVKDVIPQQELNKLLQEIRARKTKLKITR